jgi:hypothetical protein
VEGNAISLLFNGSLLFQHFKEGQAIFLIFFIMRIIIFVFILIYLIILKSHPFYNDDYSQLS